MTGTDHDSKRLPRVPTQQRSRDRFEYILDCTEKILATKTPEALSIYDVAEEASLPAQSVYRLFPSSPALRHALVQRYLDALMTLSSQLDLSHCSNWQDTVTTQIEAGSQYYRQNPLAMELVLGSEVSREIRLADRENTSKITDIFVTRIAPWVGIKKPQQLTRQLEILVDMVDAIWSQSYHHHGDITPFYVNESARAAISYLELYLPRYSPAEDCEQV